jgi:EAL domain-containing protein (putative c-di-GMP-specific phosphodiesterase class I)
LTDAPFCNATVEACLLLGRELGLRIVAEGVEAEEHWQMLRSNGATTAQGYFIAKAMPIEDLLEWMRLCDTPIAA